jgi:uncharacterized protein (TIGR02271 family)
MKTVVGVFDDASEARMTFDELVRSGFGQSNISVVTGHATGAGMNLGLRAMDTSDVGRLSGRGPLADAMSGASRLGLSGHLREYGFSKELADHYARAVRDGETLESLMVDDADAERAVSIMKRHAARMGEPERRTTDGASELEGERMIPILREEIHVGKRAVERGHVHVGVHVTERPVTETVSLREEHVEIERRPTNRMPRADEPGFQDAELDITEYGEEPIIAKEVKVVEEVVVKRRRSDHEEVIRDTVRQSSVDVADDRFDRGFYQKHFESLGSKGKLDEQLPAYELGHRLRGGKWEEMEPKAKAAWESKRPGTWESVKEAVKYAATRRR